MRHKFWRQVTDYSTVLAPLNAFITAFSAVPRQPMLDVNEFPEVKPITEQWRTIREEAIRLFEDGYIRPAAKHNDVAFNTFFKRGWKRFYIKWYDQPLPSAQALCPRTVEIVQSIPQINAAASKGSLKNASVATKKRIRWTKTTSARFLTACPPRVV